MGHCNTLNGAVFDNVYPFVPIAHFPLKTSENRKVFSGGRERLYWEQMGSKPPGGLRTMFRFFSIFNEIRFTCCKKIWLESNKLYVSSKICYSYVIVIQFGTVE